MRKEEERNKFPQHEWKHYPHGTAKLGVSFLYYPLTFRHYQTSSSLYGVGAEENAKQMPVSYQPAEFMFSMASGKALLSENKLRYPLPEVMLTPQREFYVETVIKAQR
jgi:hypothetical protein